jgi:hypothetical protein
MSKLPLSGRLTTVLRAEICQEEDLVSAAFAIKGLRQDEG